MVTVGTTGNASHSRCLGRSFGDETVDAANKMSKTLTMTMVIKMAKADPINHHILWYGGGG